MLSSLGKLAVKGLPVISITSSALIILRKFARSIASAAAGSSFSNRANIASIPNSSASLLRVWRTIGSVSGKLSSSITALM